nr:hypothetical protein [uncultured Acetobacterium sp.]
MFINEPDYLHNTYGKEMIFTFPLMIAQDWKEDQIRKAVRDFVDQFGENGRVMCWIMPETNDPSQDAIARGGLYHYSLTYYNKLYGRE